MRKRPGIAIFPPYRPSWVALHYRLIGLTQDHAGLQWSWIAGLMLLTYQLVSTKHKKTNIENVLYSLAKLMLNDENNQKIAFVPEVYKNNKPFANFFYESEKSFAWGRRHDIGRHKKRIATPKSLTKSQKRKKRKLNVLVRN